MLPLSRPAPRGGGASPLSAEVLLQQLALPLSERQRVARALRVAAPRTLALCILLTVRLVVAFVRHHASDALSKRLSCCASVWRLRRWRERTAAGCGGAGTWRAATSTARRALQSPLRRCAADAPRAAGGAVGRGGAAAGEHGQQPAVRADGGAHAGAGRGGRARVAAQQRGHGGTAQRAAALPAVFACQRRCASLGRRRLAAFPRQLHARRPASRHGRRVHRAALPDGLRGAAAGAAGAGERARAVCDSAGMRRRLVHAQQVAHQVQPRCARARRAAGAPAGAVARRRLGRASCRPAPLALGAAAPRPAGRHGVAAAAGCGGEHCYRVWYALAESCLLVPATDRTSTPQAARRGT